MEPFRASLAILPLAVYLLVVGFINLSRRPFLTSGARDLYALGVALSGLMLVGPIELFLPQAAVLRFGSFVWVLLIAFYFLTVTFLALIVRPRIVLYNISLDELRPILGRLVSELDSEHRWAGNSVALPSLGVQLQIDRFSPLRNIALTANSTDQSYAGWRVLERRLVAELANVETPPNPSGVFFVSVSSLLFATTIYALTMYPDAVFRGLQSWLRM